MKRVCLICEKEFDAYPAYVKRGGGIYCSRKCKDKAQSMRMKALPPEKGIHWNGGLIQKECLNCNKEIEVRRCFADKPKFCSRSCANSFNVKRREKTGKVLQCLTCGKDFYRVLSAINRKEKKPRFCSQKCRSIHCLKNQKKEGTDIEIILEHWLLENQVAFQKQFNAKGIALVDFFIEPNVCLFADGDYWHSLPKRKQVDKRQTSELENEGYTVIRVLGSKLLSGEYPCEVLQYCQ